MGLKFKPTKWEVPYCPHCQDIWGHRWNCKRNHSRVDIPNLPFFMAEVRISYMAYKGWAKLTDPTGKFATSFMISPSNLETIILERGIEPGGRLSNSWWMWAKVGQSYSLKWVPEDDSDE